MRTWLAVFAASVLLLTACSTSEDANETPVTAPWQAIQTPVSFAALSEDEVIDAATVEAGHIIGDSPVQEATAQLTTWTGARASLADRGFEKESRSPDNPGLPLDHHRVWLVILKGLFYEPEGPPGPRAASPTPRQPVCAEVIVIMVDPAAREEGTDWASKLSFVPAEGCS